MDCGRSIKKKKKKKGKQILDFDFDAVKGCERAVMSFVYVLPFKPS